MTMRERESEREAISPGLGREERSQGSVKCVTLDPQPTSLESAIPWGSWQFGGIWVKT